MKENDYSALLLIVAVVVLVLAIRQYWNREKFPGTSAVMVTGPMGSGKTWTGVDSKVKWFKQHLRMYKLGRILRHVWIIGDLLEDRVWHSWYPKVYTNFPVCLCRKRWWQFWTDPERKPHAFHWSDVLKREHVLLQEDIAEYSSGIFDEIGLSANQWSFDDDNIQSQNVNENYHTLDVWVKFLRQFYTGDEGQFIFIDQTASAINKPLRSRIGVVYNMIRTYRWLGITPWQKTDINILMNTEDNITNVNSVNENEDERQRYFFRFVGYRIPLLTYKHYDSRCYQLANTYDAEGNKLGFSAHVDFDNWEDNPTGFLTNYVPDLRMSAAERFDRDVKIATFKQSVKRAVPR